MLTQSQKEKLRPFTLHPKFGKLLIEAMNVWETAIPYQGGYGITRWLSVGHEQVFVATTKYRFDDRNDNKCCLIGACLVSKTVDEAMSMEGSVNEYFNLQYDETRALIHGFDEELNSIHSDSEGYVFANQVAKIIFHENE
jgi:hypothetical protein